MEHITVEKVDVQAKKVAGKLRPLSTTRRHAMVKRVRMGEQLECSSEGSSHDGLIYGTACYLSKCCSLRNFLLSAAAAHFRAQIRVHDLCRWDMDPLLQLIQTRDTSGDKSF